MRINKYNNIRGEQRKIMLICGPSLLSLYCGSSVPFLRVGGIQRESNWPRNCKGGSNCPNSSNLSRHRSRRSITCKYPSEGGTQRFSLSRRLCHSYSLAVTAFLTVTAAAVIASVATAADATYEPETLSNIPQTLSGECRSAKDCKKARIQKPKSRKAESCTIKCVTTCIRGGDGSPGEGPLNVRRYKLH